MQDPEADGEADSLNEGRRILKVRLPRDQVIRLHEMRILRGRSIANLLENILEDYFEKADAPATPLGPGPMAPPTLPPGPPQIRP